MFCRAETVNDRLWVVQHLVISAYCVPAPVARGEGLCHVFRTPGGMLIDNCQVTCTMRNVHPVVFESCNVPRACALKDACCFLHHVCCAVTTGTWELCYMF